MARMIQELSQVLAKQQAVFGSAEASLVNTDIFFCEPGAKIALDAQVDPVMLIGAGFPQSPSVVGRMIADLSMSCRLRTRGTEGGIGEIGLALKAMGFKEVASDTDADSGTDQYVYTPSNKVSEWKDLTVWGHTGNLDTANALIRKIQNAMFSGKFSLDFDKGTAKLDLTGKGIYTAAAVAGTQATATVSDALQVDLKGATISIMGDSDYEPISAEFDISQDVVVLVKPSVAFHGCGLTIVRNRLIKGSVKVFKDIPTIADPETSFKAGTLAAISIAVGTAPNKFTFATTKAQLQNVQDSDFNGVECWDLPFICVDNDLTITINTAVA